MANLTKDRATTANATNVMQPQLVANALAATIYYIGTIQVIDGNGRAVNPGAGNVALAGAKAGVVKDRVDNSLGANDALKVELKTGIHCFDKHGVNTPGPGDAGKLAYASDNHTISTLNTDGPLVGRIWQVNANSVDVNFGPALN